MKYYTKMNIIISSSIYLSIAFALIVESLLVKLLLINSIHFCGALNAAIMNKVEDDATSSWLESNKNSHAIGKISNTCSSVNTTAAFISRAIEQ
jgi:post-segregation antitoxin (ccd killing protein)